MEKYGEVKGCEREGVYREGEVEDEFEGEFAEVLEGHEAEDNEEAPHERQHRRADIDAGQRTSLTDC